MKKLTCRKRSFALSAIAVAALAGCVDLAPVYRRPDAPPRSPLADAANDDAAALPASRAYELGWKTFIADDRLRRVVARALDNNRDLRVAALNIEKARASYRIQEASRFPNVQGAASQTRSHALGTTTNDWSASINVNYEVDLFGRIRNLSDAAIAAYFSSIENRRSAQLLLVSEVASAWLTLAADLQRLALSQQTFESQRAGLDLTLKIRDLGGTSGLAVAQIRSTVEAARVQVASLRTQIVLDRNALDLLVGEPLANADGPAGDLPVGTNTLFDVPIELPSTVLIQRPDVQASERALQSTYFSIGAARARFFPRVTLTGGAGTASADLSGLFRTGTGSWSFGPSITLPLFDGGFNRANLANAEADRDIAVANYERTLQVAFREVADVLAAKATLAERTAGQEALVDTLATSFRLSDAVFRQGGSSYLTVLTAQQGLYGAQQSLISLRLEEQTTRIALYKALGGGWSGRGGRAVRLPRHKGFWIAIALVVAAAAWAIVHFAFGEPPAPQVTTTAVVKSDIEEGVLATGTIEAARLVSVGAQVTGVLTKLQVALGDRVVKGPADRGDRFADAAERPAQGRGRRAQRPGATQCADGAAEPDAPGGHAVACPGRDRCRLARRPRSLGRVARDPAGQHRRTRRVARAVPAHGRTPRASTWATRASPPRSTERSSRS